MVPFRSVLVLVLICLCFSPRKGTPPRVIFKARQVSLPFSRTLHKKAPRMRKIKETLTQRLIFNSVNFWERRGPIVRRHTARFFPTLINLWVYYFSVAAKFPPITRKFSPGLDFYPLPTVAENPQRNNTKSGEMPMSPLTSAPAPPSISGRLTQLITPHFPGWNCGGSVRSGSSRLCASHKVFRQTNLKEKNTPQVAPTAGDNKCATSPPQLEPSHYVQKASEASSKTSTPMENSIFMISGSWEPENVSVQQYVGGSYARTFHIQAHARVAPNDYTILRLAVDSGTAYNVINSRVIPFASTRPLTQKIPGKAAGGQFLPGGDREMRINLQVGAHQNGSELQVHLPTAFVGYDMGDTSVDGLLSLRWLSERGILLDPEYHRLKFRWWSRNDLIRPSKKTPPYSDACFYVNGLEDPPIGSITGRQLEVRNRRKWHAQNSPNGTRIIQPNGQISGSPPSSPSSIKSFATNESFSTRAREQCVVYAPEPAPSIAPGEFDPLGRLLSPPGPNVHPLCPLAPHLHGMFYVDDEGFMYDRVPTQRLLSENPWLSGMHANNHFSKKCDCVNFTWHKEWKGDRLQTVYNPINMVEPVHGSTHVQPVQPAVSSRLHLPPTDCRQMPPSPVGALRVVVGPPPTTHDSLTILKTFGSAGSALIFGDVIHHPM